VSRHSHLGRVLVEELTVVEDELSVCCKLLAAAVAEAGKPKRTQVKNLTKGINY